MRIDLGKGTPAGVKHASAAKVYLGCLFLLLMTNAISSTLGAIGIRGLAFYHIQALLLASCLFHMGLLVLRGRLHITIGRTLLRLILCSIAYTILSCLLLVRFGDIVPAYVLLMLYTFLVYPVMATAMLGCERCYVGPGHSLKSFPGWLAWASSGILLFGWVQFAAHDTIIRVTNTENVSKLVNASLLGTFRPPSVFESSFQYGLLAVLVFCLSFAHAVYGRGGMRAWALSALAMGSVVLSQTRNVYLCAACAIASFFLLRLALRRRKVFMVLRYSPWLYVIASLGVMFWAVWQFLASDLRKTGDLTDASSTLSRVSGWLAAWQNLVLPGSFFDACFGYGITQAGQASDYQALYPSRGTGLFIDSTFVNLFLFQGLIGLLFFVSIYWAIWRRLVRKLEEELNPLVIGVTCFFAAFLAAGVLNIVNGQWWGITLSLSFLVLASSYKKKSVA